ncbi:MAG TPA: isochorismatase family protein [Lactobacillaceae bacterium]
MTDIAINWAKTALVVIDLQKNIAGIDGLKPYSGADVVARNDELIAALQDKIGLIALVNVGPTSADAGEMLAPTIDSPASARPSAPDTMDLVVDVPKTTNVVRVTKHNWGAFYGTDLDAQLRRRGIDTLILTGIATTIGVDTTAREAFQHGYNQIIIEDAITDFDAELHAQIVTKIFPRFAQVRQLADLLD